jgi:multiple sugar transport system permease protein
MTIVDKPAVADRKKLRLLPALARTARILALLFATTIFFLPILGSLLTSVRTVGDILRNGGWSIPNPFSPENFIGAAVGLASYLKASTIVTLPSIMGVLLVASMASYAISRLRFSGRMVVFFTLITLSFVPVQVQLIPIFSLFNAIGLYDTYLAIIIVQIMRHIPFAVLVLTSFFNTVPAELREAARVDGASEWTVYWRIFIPIGRPAFVALLVLEFTWIWNDLLWGLVLVQSNDKRPVTVGILNFQGEHTVAWPLIAAGAVVAALPTVMVFLLFQKHFIRGMTMGAVKG